MASQRYGRIWGVENGIDNVFRSDLGGDIHNTNPSEELNLFFPNTTGILLLLVCLFYNNFSSMLLFCKKVVSMAILIAGVSTAFLTISLLAHNGYTIYSYL